VERMKIQGGCHCGDITYDADINPDYVVICHCTDCQNISGAPYRVNVPVLAENFNLRGTPKTYVKTGDSGNKVVHAFCATCGTALYSQQALESPRSFMLRVGAVKERAQLVPKKQGFCRSAMPWAMDISGIPKVPVRTKSQPPQLETRDASKAIE
jgi:hypothetical protein